MNAMMSVLNNNLLRALLIGISIVIFILINLINNKENCSEIYDSYKMQSGKFHIDTLYIDLKVHERVIGGHAENKLYYFLDMFNIQPCVGDSIYKEKGKLEYVLIKADSTYVQSWNCETKGAFIIDKWKNGEKKYVPSNKAIPQPGDTSNSIYISTKKTEIQHP